MSPELVIGSLVIGMITPNSVDQLRSNVPRRAAAHNSRMPMPVNTHVKA